MARGTRIHLDQIEGPGHFLELEVVRRDGETTDYGVTVAREVMRRLEVLNDPLFVGAYVDFLSPLAIDGVLPDVFS